MVTLKLNTRGVLNSISIQMLCSSGRGSFFLFLSPFSLLFPLLCLSFFLFTPHIRIVRRPRFGAVHHSTQRTPQRRPFFDCLQRFCRGRGLGSLVYLDQLSQSAPSSSSVIIASSFAFGPITFNINHIMGVFGSKCCRLDVVEVDTETLE